MSVNVQTINGTYVKRMAEITSQSVVECRIAGDGIGEVLCAVPQVHLLSCEVSSGRVNYGGRLICTAVYADGRGKLNRIQKGAEFTHFADNDVLAPAQTAICSLTCERAAVRRDGTAFVITAVICAHITVYGNAERLFIAEAEGAVCRTEPIKLLNVVTFSGESEVEDDFEAAGVADILMYDARAVTTDCRCGAGEIQISGEIYLSMLAIRGEEPVALDRIIPFSAEIVCDDAAFGGKADCLTAISDANVIAQVDEERGKCNLRFTAALTFRGSFTEEREADAVTDAFCTDSETQVQTCSEAAAVCEGIKTYTERVSGPCATGAKIDYACSFKVAVSPKAECTYSADTGVLEGAVSCVLVYLKEGDLHSTDVTLPFSVKISGLDTPRIEAAVIGVSVRQRSEGECEAEATLKITAANYVHAACTYVTGIEVTEPITDFSAVTVLIPDDGDTLWDIAKKLRRSPQDVTAACPSLTFPVTSERIVIYRPKIM